MDKEDRDIIIGWIALNIFLIPFLVMAIIIILNGG